MTKLPVLFVSCHAGSLKLHEDSSSGAARMIWGKPFNSVVLVSTRTGGDPAQIVRIKGDGATTEAIKAMLSAQNQPPDVVLCKDSDRPALVQALLGRELDEITELQLNTGLGEQDYRRIGQSLEALRDQGVLMLCLNNRDELEGEARTAAHDRQLREILNRWVQDQQWGAAVSLKGEKPRSVPTLRLDDPTLCLLNAAFSLGGSQFPQRMFSSGMNCAHQMLSGFGWMR